MTTNGHMRGPARILTIAALLMTSASAGLSAQSTVRGRVTEQGAANPIPGATVELGGVATVATDRDGHFEIRNVPAGPHHILVSAIGYRPRPLALIIRADTLLEIELEVQPVSLTPLAVDARPVTVSGRVTDAAAGRPIYDADVIAGEDRVLTNVDGRYRIRRVPAGREVILEVRAFGYMPEAVALELTADSTLDFELDIDPVGQRILDLKLEEIAERATHSPFTRRLIDREELVRRSAWSAKDLVQDRIPFRRGIGCLIVDEREVQVPPMDYLATWIAPEIESIEVLTYFRSVMVRVYTRRFMQRMVGGAVRLRPLIPNFCG